MMWTEQIIDELHGAMHYAEMAKELPEFYFLLHDMAEEELCHARHLKHMAIKHGVSLDEIHEQWNEAYDAVYG